MDPQIIGTLTRVDGEVGEELFAGDPGEIIEFIDQVLEVRHPAHSANERDPNSHILATSIFA